VSDVQGLNGETADTLIEAIRLGCGEKNTVVLDAENGVMTADYVPERRLVYTLDFAANLYQEPARREMDFRDNGSPCSFHLSYKDKILIYRQMRAWIRC
jgi:hypothetical protein